MRATASAIPWTKPLSKLLQPAASYLPSPQCPPPAILLNAQSNLDPKSAHRFPGYRYFSEPSCLTMANAVGRFGVPCWARKGYRGKEAVPSKKMSSRWSISSAGHGASPYLFGFSPRLKAVSVRTYAPLNSGRRSTAHPPNSCGDSRQADARRVKYRQLAKMYKRRRPISDFPSHDC